MWNVLRIFRLHETIHSRGGPHGNARDLYMDTRRLPRWRRWPTHQPVEQEAQIRLLEKLQNHSGRNAMLVLRPADVQETTVAWKLALENDQSPTGLILSRQNINDLPAKTSRFEEALEANKGAYIVQDEEDYDVILLASGSEVSTLVDGAKLLRADGVKVRVVSVPSEGLFRTQPEEYQEAVLPKGPRNLDSPLAFPSHSKA